MMSAMADSPNVLVALDGSTLAEHALPYAVALHQPGSALVLVTVVSEPEPVYGLLGDTVTTKEDVAAAYTTMGQAILDAAAKRVDPRVPVQKVVAVGDPAARILDTVPENAVGMIVIASHGRGAIGRLTFGSVADRLARASPVPVLIVRPSAVAEPPASATIRRLVVPLDGSSLAAEALPVAAAIAQRLHLPVLLIRALDVASWLPPAPFGPGIGAPVELFDQLSHELQEEAASTLQDARARLEVGGVEAETKIVNGPASQTIAEAAGPTDVIVLTSHGRGGVRRWLLGSVAERLVRTGPAPVLLVPTSLRTTTAGQ